MSSYDRGEMEHKHHLLLHSKSTWSIIAVHYESFRWPTLDLYILVDNYTSSFGRVGTGNYPVVEEVVGLVCSVLPLNTKRRFSFDIFTANYWPTCPDIIKYKEFVTVISHTLWEITITNLLYLHGHTVLSESCIIVTSVRSLRVIVESRTDTHQYLSAYPNRKEGQFQGKTVE